MKDDNEGELQGLQRPVGYEGLMERLIAKMGLNLAHCRKYFGLHHKTIQRMMGRCAACAESGTCKVILSETKGQMQEPPEFCYNRKILMSLKADTDSMMLDSEKPHQESSKKT